MTEASASRRFVVLRHEGVPQPHFDLMIESTPGGKLLTWRSDVWPIVEPTNLKHLGDHRRDYLDYEGPLSGGRGHVKRVAAGTADMHRATDDELIADLAGISLHIRRLVDDRWLAQ